MAGYDEFERILNYKFNDRSYLLQAMSHASYSPNRVTDCYQRLEFLGDAVLGWIVIADRNARCFTILAFYIGIC